VGNVVDADGKPLSHDTINDALELMEISFDRHGNPKLPTLVASPQAAEDLNRQAPTPEQQNRRQEILLRKKREHDAKKRHRRLPRQSH
jgi:hypothetical protein